MEQSSSAQQAGEQGMTAMPSLGSALQVLFWLAVIVGLILLCAWILRRAGGMSGGRGGVIRILTAISLGSRDRIALVEVGDRQILLGISPGRINTLHVFEEPVLDSSSEPVSGGAHSEFARRLQSTMRKVRRDEH